MKNIIYFFLAIILCFNNSISAQALYENLPKPTPTQLSWQDMELTMFIHFGPATWQDQEYDDLSTPLSKINPSKLNTDQWANVAKSYGAKMIIFSAKHWRICLVANRNNKLWNKGNSMEKWKR